MSGWTRSDAIAILALLVAFGSFWVSWRRHRRDIRSERPIFWAQRPFHSLSRTDWHHIEVRMRNRAPYAVQCEQIEILRPRRAVIATYWDIMQTSKSGEQEFKAELSATSFFRTGRMRLAATHAGLERPIGLIKHHGAGDVDDEPFFVHCAPRFRLWARSSRKPIKLLMRITWRSKDESSRRQTSDVYTELIPARTSASSAT